MMASARDGAEQGRDVAEARAEAIRLGHDGSAAMAERLEKEVADKSALLTKYQETLQKLSIADLLGEEGAKLKDDAADLVALLDSLRTRLEVFREASR